MRSISLKLRAANGMAHKERRSETELTAMLMQEFRKHPKCNHITGIAITRRAKGAWGVGFVRDGAAITCSEAFEIVADFQRKYDLA